MAAEADTEVPVKLYFRIGEVSQIVGVEPHVLRYWESEFRSIRPQKSRKGQRIYSRRDVDKLLKVRELLYNQGFTIAGARKRLRDQSDVTGEPGGSARLSRGARSLLLELRHEIRGMLAELEGSDPAV